jgi:hypothetical protein
MAQGNIGALESPGEEWRARAVTELKIPDCFLAGEERFVPRPFEPGDIIETRAFQVGYRGAWFLSEVRN